MNPDSVVLKADLLSYRDSRLNKHERQAQGIDGSEMALRIVSTLLRAGCTEEEIAEYFERYQPPRYSEELDGRSWVSYLIKTATNSAEGYPEGTLKQGSTNPPLRVMENQQSLVEGRGSDARRRQYNDIDLPFWIVNRRLQGEEQGEFVSLMEWYDEIIDVSGRGITKPVALSTAREKARRLRKKGYVETERVRGRTERVRLTDRGRRNAVPQKGGWPRAIWLGEATPSEAEAQTLDRFLGQADSSIDTEDRGEKTKSRTKAHQKPRSAEQKRRSRILRLRQKERINDFYRLTFPGNKKRYIQILTPREGWMLGSLWEQKLVGFDSEGLPLFRSVATNEFESGRLDPNGWDPPTRMLAIAADLVCDGEGYRIAEYDDEQGELHPAIGVISQSRFNFWDNLPSDDPCSKILLVRGSGQGKKRVYQFEPVADAIEIRTEVGVADVIASLESPDSGHAFERLPDGWLAMPEGRQRLLHQLGCIPGLEVAECVSGRGL